jgi:thymidylate synthase
VNGKFDYTYNERIIHVIHDLIKLLKDDPDTRKAVLPIFNGDIESIDTLYYDGSRRIPCSMYYDFLIRENAKREKVLNICYHQRSSDYCVHFGNDVYLAWRLMEYVAKEVGIKSGYLYHTIDSLHSYKKDWHYLSSNIEDLIIK